MRVQRNVAKERLIKGSIWLGNRISFLVGARCQVGSRFWGHSAMTISRLAGTMGASDSSFAIGDRRGPLWLESCPLGGARILVTIAACMSAIPVAAQAPAPTTTAFDDTYAGVSRTFEGNMSATSATPRGCLPNGQPPGPLTIAGGVVRYAGGTAEGSVNAQGVLVLRAPNGERLDAQIDGRGAVTGRFTGSCSYHLVWQKGGQVNLRK